MSAAGTRPAVPTPETERLTLSTLRLDGAADLFAYASAPDTSPGPSSTGRSAR